MTKNKFFAALLSLLIVFTAAGMLYPFSGFADEGGVELICSDEDDAVEGMYWRIYKIGERRDGKFVLIGEFARYPIDLTVLSAENISGAAKALESFVLRDGLSFLGDGLTNDSGTVGFGALDIGLYLAIPRMRKTTYYEYTSVPLIFEVKDDSVKETVFPKIYVNAVSSGVSRNYAVKKVWDDGLFSDMRPLSIEVMLYKDGALAETVTLCDDNNWQYQWTSPDDSEWRVAERAIPGKYAVSIEYNINQFLIRNSYSESIIDYGFETFTTTTTTTATVSTLVTTSHETETELSTDDKSTAQKMTTDSTSPTITTTDSSSSLPQTGQLWWPVIPLVAAGLLFILAGILISSDRKDS